MAVEPIPRGYHTVTPYLIVRGCAKALEFYRGAFGAEEIFRMEMPGGTIGHAEMTLGDSHLMLADEQPDMGYVGPESLGGSSVSLMVYVPEVDRVFAGALAAGATEVQAVEAKFWGDRAGVLRDPFGHVWTLATHVEDVSEEEIRRRGAEMMGG